MGETLDFLARHGYAVLFIWVLAEQIGLPIPALPMLLAAGALAADGRLTFALALLVAVSASLISDLVWYQIGRRRGGRVLNLLCRISLEPDSCVRRTENIFQRYGARSLLVAKFIPGLNTAAPPMAGVTRMPLWRFLVFDIAGAGLWAASIAAVGVLFSRQLDRLLDYAEGLGRGFIVLLVLAFAAYIFWRFMQRRRFLQQLMRERISPQDLRRKLEAREPLTVIDLRHALDFLVYPQLIPGAIRLDPDELDRRHDEIPRDGEIILYCT